MALFPFSNNSLYFNISVSEVYGKARPYLSFLLPSFVSFLGLTPDTPG